MKAYIILANAGKINKEELNNSFIIGADKGAYYAITNGIIPDISIGDYDSCTNEEIEVIKKNSKKVITLNSIKDKSDTNEAIDLVKDYDEIIILGGIKGKRFDHLYANILELKNNPKLKMVDDETLMLTTSMKHNVLTKYKYMSVFALEDSVIDIVNCKYPLTNYYLKTNDPLGLSNEPYENGYIDIKKGRVLIIYSIDDH